MSWNQSKSNLPKKGEGPEHKMAKEVAAAYIHVKYGYDYRFEYPVKAGSRRHKYDAVFWHPTSTIYVAGEWVGVTLMMRRYNNDKELLKSIYKQRLDNSIKLVLEIDDYTKHTHKEQLINDGEAEALAREVFAPKVRIIRVKKEDIVEWQTKKELVTIENSGKVIDAQCKGLKRTFLVR